MKFLLLIFASSFIFVSMKKTTTKRPKTTTKRTTTKRPSGTLRCFDCNSYDDNCGDFDESSSGSWETCSRSDYCIKQTMTNPKDGRKYSGGSVPKMEVNTSKLYISTDNIQFGLT